MMTLPRYNLQSPQSKNEQKQYDEFLHKIQQTKMKELWDNDEDEAWKNA
jgi:hypothetical protein